MLLFGLSGDSRTANIVQRASRHDEDTGSGRSKDITVQPGEGAAWARSMGLMPKKRKHA